MSSLRLSLFCASLVVALACRRERPAPARNTQAQPAAPAFDGSACSTQGAPCCAGERCGGRLNCIAGSCQPCGERPLPCCTHAPTPCRNGVCLSGRCAVPPRTCGHRGQPCCEGQCGGSFRCVDGACMPRDADCGELGQACCPEEHRDDCGNGLHCAGGTCQPKTCGREGMPCCPRGEPCGPRFTCIDNVCRVAP